MRFKSDAQRKAMFASLNNNRFSTSPGDRLADMVVGLYPSGRSGSSSVFAAEPNEGMRRHKLMPEELKAKIPKLYSQENEADPMVWGKFFSPYSGYTFYITEFDGDDTLFGYVTGLAEDELGYASLNELASANKNGLPLIERDKYFSPKRLSEVKGS